MMVMKKYLLTVSVLLLSVFTVSAEVKMPLIFGDHMVLQQNSKLNIWGWADAGEKVTVNFAGQTVATTAANDGTWKVELQPVKTNNQGETLTVKGKNTITISDVLVGDVWVASGQSNMEFGVKRFKDDVEKADDPELRLFFVPRNTSLEPLHEMEIPKETENPDWAAKWVKCTPEALNKINGQGFASTAYFFARDIRKANNRPLGMIQSAWGGTRAEAWTSLSGLQKEPPFKNYLANYERNVKDNPEIVANYEQKKAEFDAALKEWDATVGKEWNQAQKDWAAACKAAAANGQPVPPEPKPSKPRPSNPRQPNGGNNGPSNLFNAMISPLMPLTIKGVIWYQGEFNSGGSGKEYATLFPRMISDWREKWGIGDFPFVFVQLPNFGPVDSETFADKKGPGDGWCYVREGQLKTLALPNTAMAVAIDIGDPFDLHPPDKQDVGQRLALAARQVAYDEKIVGMGPIYDSMTVNGSKITLSFKNCGSGLEIGVSPYVPAKGEAPKKLDKLSSFGIAGEDQKFYPADAVIEGDKVIVSSDKVPHPVAVRYGFTNSPLCNLYNKEGLPAAPFRTDDWDK
jgi:sialate O-acetylesterase